MPLNFQSLFLAGMLSTTAAAAVEFNRLEGWDARKVAVAVFCISLVAAMGHLSKEQAIAGLDGRKRKARRGKTTTRKKSKESEEREGSVEDTVVDAMLAARMLQSGVYVDDVEPEDAADLAKELQGDVLKKLSHNKVRKAFVFDFLSALAGRHLKGATKIDGKVPAAEEYEEGGSFYWKGLRVTIMRKLDDDSICGLGIFHQAYLSQFPGDSEEFFSVDPIVRLGENKKNMAKEIGNDGSKLWTDIPVICGQGYGRLLLAKIIVDSPRQKFMVNVAGGMSNRRMTSLLHRFEFDELSMSHPKSGKPWVDEVGVPLVVYGRVGKLSGDEVEVNELF